MFGPPLKGKLNEPSRITNASSAGSDYRDADDRVVNFYSQRHHYNSALSGARVHPRAARHLARHSTIELTMMRYTRLSMANFVAAMDSNREPTATAGTTLRATTADDRWLRAKWPIGGKSGPN